MEGGAPAGSQPAGPGLSQPPGSQSNVAAPASAPPGLPSSSEDSIIGSPEPPAAPVSGVSYVGADGSFTQDWVAKLPEDLAPARESLKNFRTVNDLAKGYYQTKQAVGKKGVILPTAESSPEEVASYRKAMGVPDSPDGYYAVKENVILPEGVVWRDDIAETYFQVAHKHNIPASAMQELVQIDVKRRELEGKAAISEIQEQKQQNLMVLRQTWGANFDRNVEIARRAATTVGVSPNSYGFRDPEVVRGFVRLASMMGEQQLVSSSSAMPSGSGDFAAMAKDIQTNTSNPKYKAYHDGDPETQAIVRQYLIRASSSRR